MIRMVKGKRRYVPQIVCDGCGEPITDYRIAHILWFVDPESGEVMDGMLYHTHKGPCADDVTARYGADRCLAWCPLRQHLGHLLHNAGVRGKRAAAEAWEDAIEWSQIG